MTDQLPPHNIEAEQAFLGSLLIDRDAIAEVADWVPTAAFFDGRHSLIYRAMLWLWQQRRPCDAVTLNETLEKYRQTDLAGGPAYMATLMVAVPTAVHVRHYGEIVVAHAKRRAVIEAATEVVQSAYRDDVEIDAMAGVIRAVADSFPTPSGEADGVIDSAMDDHQAKVLDRWEGRLVEHVVPTGIFPVDQMMHGGLRAGDLAFIGGRPGMGKTSMMLQMAKMAAIRTGTRSLIVSLEMSAESILNRLIAAEAGVPFGIAYQRFGDIGQRDDWLAAADRIRSIPLVVETNLRTTDRIAAYCQRSPEPIGAIFIDQLNYLKDGSGMENITQREAEKVRRSKELASLLEVPVVVLAQLNRGVEDRPPFTPTLSSFKHTGAIEEDMDYGFLLYRRLYYVAKGMLDPDDGQDYVTASNQHRVTLYVAKNRNGEVGTVGLGWEPKTMSFHEIARAA